MITLVPQNATKASDGLLSGVLAGDQLVDQS